MKKVYIAHPIGGDVDGNLVKVAEIIREITLNAPNVIPIAPYFVLCHALDDTDPEERKRGMEVGLDYIKHASGLEIWLYGDRISAGMKAEIKHAQHYGFSVIPMTKGTETDFINL